MEKKKVSSVINRIALEGRPEFNVVLAYDEIAGAMRAKECFDDLTRLHGELFKFKCQAAPVAMANAGQQRWGLNE